MRRGAHASAAMMCSHGYQQHPCLSCQPRSYIRMVQHLIERCLVVGMTQDDCVHALAKHAGIKPQITITVWRELMKENRGFFQAYFDAMAPHSRPSLYSRHDRHWPYY